MKGSSFKFEFLIEIVKNLESYAAKALAVNFQLSSRPEFDAIIEKYKGLTESDHLENSYIKSQKDNVFYLSGFRPYRLICLYLWIEK